MDCSPRLFRAVQGYPPFFADHPLRIYEKIVAGKPRYPAHFSAPLHDLLARLLQSDVTRRLGCMHGGARDVRHHPFFAPLSWAALLHKTLPAPYLPPVSVRAGSQCCMAAAYSPFHAPLQGPGDASQYDAYEEHPIEVAPSPEFEAEFAAF